MHDRWVMSLLWRLVVIITIQCGSSQSNNSSSPSIAPTPLPTSIIPSIISFDIDESVGLVTFLFNTEVAAVSLNASRIFLQSNASLSSYINGLTIGPYAFNNLSLQGNTTTLEYYLLDDTYAAYMISNIGRYRNQTYLSYLTGAFTSNLNVSTLGLSSTQAIQVATLTPDTRQPYAKSFNFDMNYGYVSITFSEPVNGFRYKWNYFLSIP